MITHTGAIKKELFSNISLTLTTDNNRIGPSKLIVIEGSIVILVLELNNRGQVQTKKEIGGHTFFDITVVVSCKCKGYDIIENSLFFVASVCVII